MVPKISEAEEAEEKASLLTIFNAKKSANRSSASMIAKAVERVDIPKKPFRLMTVEEVQDMEHRQNEQARAFKAEQFWAKCDVPIRHREQMEAVLADAGGKWLEKLEYLRSKLPMGFIAALLGKRWTGKTQLATCLIHNACQAGIASRYLKAMDLFREIRSCYRKDGPDEIKTVKRFVGYGLLVIDEAHERSDSDWENRTLTNIIDHRYDNKKCTLLISNQEEKAFREAVGPSVWRRILETGDSIVCDWEIFRTKEQQ